MTFLALLSLFWQSLFAQGIPFNANGMAHAQGGTVISLLGGGNGYAQCEGGANGCTTSAINTTGASLLVGLDCNYTAGPGFSYTDSKSNTWTPLSTYTSTAGNEQCRLLYATNPTVGSGHTVHNTGSGSYAAVALLDFAGANTSTPFVAMSDVGTYTAICQTVTPCPPGSVSIATGNVEVTFFTVPFGFTVTGTLPAGDSDYVIDGSIHSGSNEGFTIAHLIPVTTAARNPSWRPSSGSLAAATAAASFAHQ